MPIPNRNWLLRARRQMCVNYHDLCGIITKNEERKREGHKSVYTEQQEEDLREAKNHMSEAIDRINYIVELPKGS